MEAAAEESFERRLKRKSDASNDDRDGPNESKRDQGDVAQQHSEEMDARGDDDNGMDDDGHFVHPAAAGAASTTAPPPLHQQPNLSRQKTRYLNKGDVSDYEERIQQKIAEAASSSSSPSSAEARGVSQEEGRAPFLNPRRFRRRANGAAAEERRRNRQGGRSSSNDDDGAAAAPTVGVGGDAAPRTPLDAECGVGDGVGDGDGGDGDEDGKLISAVLVDNDDVVDAVPFDEKRWTRNRIAFYLFVTLAILAVIVGLSVGLTTSNRDDEDDAAVVEETLSPTLRPSSSPSFDLRPTLQSIEEDGLLRCGVAANSWSGRVDAETGVEEGFSVDMCRAFAAAVLGNATATIKAVAVTAQDRWSLLADRAVDVLISADTHTMERDVYEPTTKRGYTFSVPYFYDGLRVAGIPEYVDCVEKQDRNQGNCSKLKICVAAGTTHLSAMSNEVPGYMLQVLDSRFDFPGALDNGTCNAIATDLSGGFSIRDRVASGELKTGKMIYSKEPLAVVTREDEPEWSDFVNVILQGLMSAEARHVTQSAPGAFPDLMLFGGRYPRAVADAIAAVGNFGELNSRHFPRRPPINRINSGSSGLIYSLPFGNMETKGLNPGPNSTLSAIRKSGRLRCGISLREGFGERRNTPGGVGNTPGGVAWEGLDAMYCSALAAAIFYGGKGNVDFVVVDFSDRFSKLAEKDIDVLSGCSLDIGRAGTNSTGTGEGFSFSQPYFYTFDNVTIDPYHALATRQDDRLWSDFVFWVVSATFYAAENDIRNRFHYLMPTVDFFGLNLNWMFKDIVRFVGNYDTIYEESGNFLSKGNSTRNVINAYPFEPQHYSLDF